MFRNKKNLPFFNIKKCSKPRFDNRFASKISSNCFFNRQLCSHKVLKKILCFGLQWLVNTKKTESQRREIHCFHEDTLFDFPNIFRADYNKHGPKISPNLICGQKPLYLNVFPERFLQVFYPYFLSRVSQSIMHILLIII